VLTSIVRVLLTATAAVISYIVTLLASFMLLPDRLALWRLLAVPTSTILVIWCVWRYSASMSGKIVSGTLVALPILAVLCWGYWRVSTYAYVYVRLYDVGLRTDRQLYGSVLSADLDLHLRDEAGRVLATGKADTGIVWLMHPQVGDCRAEQHQGQNVWRE
jgi:hypothetical protein